MIVCELLTSLWSQNQKCFIDLWGKLIQSVLQRALTASELFWRLTAIRDHSSGMKSLQKKAFVKQLLQSSALGDVPTWPPIFLSSILPLLPYLPVSHFQQLTSQQVVSHFTFWLCRFSFVIFQEWSVKDLLTTYFFVAHASGGVIRQQQSGWCEGTACASDRFFQEQESD